MHRAWLAKEKYAHTVEEVFVSYTSALEIRRVQGFSKYLELQI